MSSLAFAMTKLWFGLRDLLSPLGMYYVKWIYDRGFRCLTMAVALEVIPSPPPNQSASPGGYTL